MSNVVNRFGNGRRRFLQLSAGAGLAASGLVGGMSRAFAADSVNLHTWSAGVDTVKRMLVPFQKEAGLNVNYNNLPFAQYREAMVTKFVGQAPIDVLWVSDGWLPEWADAGWLEPLNSRKSDCGDVRTYTVTVVEELPNSLFALRWHDATFCNYEEQIWAPCLARAAGCCALSGERINKGDPVYRPRIRGRVVPLNSDAVILASELIKSTRA